MRISGRSMTGPRQRRHGVAATEFAFILPLLSLILLACVDLGRFAYSYIAVTNAADAGASYASVNPYTDATTTSWMTAVRQAVLNEMGDFNSGSITVSIKGINGSTTWT